MSGPDTTIVAFENVGLRYASGPEVLRDITFTLEPGSFHFLTGPSGAGKSSLMRMMFLGQNPTRGLLRLFGRDVGHLSRQEKFLLRRQVGVVFQDFRLLPHLSAFDNVALPLRIAGVSEIDIRKDVTEILNWVGLGDRTQARPRTLSGGEQQRIAIARAVINRPRLILADEPTGNVDGPIGLKLLHLFEELNRLGTTVVIATHDEDIVRRFGHDRLDIQNGALRLHKNESSRAA